LWSAVYGEYATAAATLCCLYCILLLKSYPSPS
jgi:hypothetical protein